jgi:hypothetical protein
MIYGKPEIVALGDASHTIQNGHCCWLPICKGTPYVDGTPASGCSGSPLAGFNPVAAYDLDE